VKFCYNILKEPINGKENTSWDSEIGYKLDRLPVCRFYWFGFHNTRNTELVCDSKQAILHSTQLVVFSSLDFSFCIDGYIGVSCVEQGFG
jgi:hypothetical protein